MLFPESPRVSHLYFLSRTKTNNCFSGSSITTDQTKACGHLLGFTPMATKMTHGSGPSSIKFRRASHLSMRTKPNHTLSTQYLPNITSRRLTSTRLFTNRSSFRRLFIACALQASIQMTGVSAIQYYSVKIYGQIGISGSDALKYQAINNIIALVGEACCVLFVDKLGRRRPLIGGNLFNMVCFLVACILIGVFLLNPPLNLNYS
jgi:hypothetical protein